LVVIKSNEIARYCFLKFKQAGILFPHFKKYGRYRKSRAPLDGKSDRLA
jgi:hypothetical protein